MNCAVKKSVRKKDIGCVFRDKTRHPGRCTVSKYILQNRTQRHSRSRIGCDKESVEVMCMAFWCRDVCQHLEQTRLVWRKSFTKSLCNVFSFTKPLAHTAFLKHCHVEDTKLFHFATLQNPLGIPPSICEQAAVNGISKTLHRIWSPTPWQWRQDLKVS